MHTSIRLFNKHVERIQLAQTRLYHKAYTDKLQYLLALMTGSSTLLVLRICLILVMLLQNTSLLRWQIKNVTLRADSRANIGVQKHMVVHMIVRGKSARWPVRSVQCTTCTHSKIWATVGCVMIFWACARVAVAVTLGKLSMGVNVVLTVPPTAHRDSQWLRVSC